MIFSDFHFPMIFQSLAINVNPNFACVLVVKKLVLSASMA